MKLNRQFTKIPLESLKQNIRLFHNNSIELGLKFPDWYGFAFDDCFDIATAAFEFYGIEMNAWQAALLISVLSPANKWETNKRDAINILNEIAYPDKQYSFFTYGNNVAKAREFVGWDLKLTQPEAIAKYLRTPKVLNFFWSILDSQTAFCVDRHMIGIAGIETTDRFPTLAQYKHIQNAFLESWIELDKPFETPAKWQAYLWQAVVFTKHGITHY